MPVLLLVIALLASPAHAQSCPADAARRLAFIESGMTQAARASRTWALTWGGVWTAATVAQGTLAFTAHEHGDRVDFGVGAGAAAVGLIPTLILPPTVIGDHARLMALSEQHTDVCPRLAAAEQMLAESAANERFGRSWVSHAGNLLFNVAVGIILGAGYHHWPSATLSMALGIPIGELMIFTQPFQSTELLRRYQGGDYSVDNRPSLGQRLRLAFAPNGSTYEVRLGLVLQEF